LRLDYYHYQMEKEMNSNSVNLVKLCVGADTIDDLKGRQENFDQTGNNIKNRKTHVTRMWPKRGDEILNGGSLFWVIKGFIQARQKIIGLEEVIGQDNIRRCAIMLDPEIFLTTSVKKRPFQGWRYLNPVDSPPDLYKISSNETTLPNELAIALADIGVR